MKVLYIGHFDQTGYGQASIGNVLALRAAGVDVVPKAIYNNNVPPVIKALSGQNTSGITHVIQHTLPSLMSFNVSSDIVNCGFFATETQNLRLTGWVHRLNLLDHVYVINRDSAEVIKRSGVTRPTFVVPHAVDVNKFQRSYLPLAEIKDQIRDSFTFYTINEAVTRKDFISLLIAFHTEFRPSEPVELVIKTTPPFEKTHTLCYKVKEGLRLHRDLERYKKELIISDFLSEEKLYSLHNTCDVYVSASHGEAFGLGAFDAMGFGKTPILSDVAGHREFLTDKEGWLIPCHNSICFNSDNTSQELHNGYDHWQSVDILALRGAMREAYQNKTLRAEKAENGFEKVYNYTYENIGKILLESLG